MTSSITFRFAVASAALAAAATGASAHVTLPPGGAPAGGDYEAAFRVGHACAEATRTTGITVRLPEGFTLAQAQPRTGWLLTSSAREVSWKAESSKAALPTAERAEFIVRGKLASQPGTLWFKVRQVCDKGSADWAQIPTGAPGEELAFPAARLDLLPAGVAAVDVRDAWVRSTVPGQSGTGAFMKLSAPSGTRLVGASTPAAGIAEVHEMKMEGDTMKMREVKNGLVLPPRETVELKPSGYHLMLMDLKQALKKGSTVDLQLRFEDAKGVKSALDMKLPVGAPDGAPGDMAGHKH